MKRRSQLCNKLMTEALDMRQPVRSFTASEKAACEQRGLAGMLAGRQSQLGPCAPLFDEPYTHAPEPQLFNYGGQTWRLK